MKLFTALHMARKAKTLEALGYNLLIPTGRAELS
jgi:hypothetical protein